MRIVPICPATMPMTELLTQNTPPRGHYAGTPYSYIPNLGRVRSHRLPRVPFRIVKHCMDLAVGLESFLKAKYAVNFYVWVDIDPDSHAVVSHRIARLRL
jgi:hypothetical protein